MKTRQWIDVSELASPADPDAQLAVDAASYVLFMLSGQKFGGIFETTEQYVCETTGAPVGCWWDPGERAYWNPALGAYTFIQDPLREMSRLATGGSIRLRRTPVISITSITVGGTVIPSASYELLNSSIVDPDGGDDTLEWGMCDGPIITYQFGVEPPPLGKIAARKLANELVLSLSGGDCTLPSTVTNVTRQGIALEMFDPQMFLEKGRVGIYEVDLFLTTVNPAKARKRPRVFSPDMPRPYRRS